MSVSLELRLYSTHVNNDINAGKARGTLQSRQFLRNQLNLRTLTTHGSAYFYRKLLSEFQLGSQQDATSWQD